MRARIAGPVVIGLLAVLLLASCGNGDDENALSEEELARRANEICSTHARNIEEAARSRFGASRNVPSVQEIEDLAKNVVVPEVDRMVDELEDLEPRKRDKGDYEDFLADTRKALDDDVKQDPVSILSEEASSDAFAEANEKADDLDMTECARVSQRIRAAAAARPPK